MEYRAEIFDQFQLLYEATGFNDHQLHCVLRFASGLDADVLRKAVVASVEAIPILGSRYIDDVQRPRWESMSPFTVWGGLPAGTNGGRVQRVRSPSPAFTVPTKLFRSAAIGASFRYPASWRAATNGVVLKSQYGEEGGVVAFRAPTGEVAVDVHLIRAAKQAVPYAFGDADASDLEHLSWRRHSWRRSPDCE